MIPQHRKTLIEDLAVEYVSFSKASKAIVPSQAAATLSFDEFEYFCAYVGGIVKGICLAREPKLRTFDMDAARRTVEREPYQPGSQA